jgi:NHL repeat-containing protein
MNTGSMPIQIAKGYSFMKKWSSNGTADGEFIYPSSVAIDSSGYVYVVETGNSRIQVFLRPDLCQHQTTNNSTGK